MVTPTTGDIALRPTDNTQQGGYYFYSLGTGQRLNRNRWTQLPMPAEVIDHIHAVACQSNASDGLSFADRNGIDPHDSAGGSDEETYNPANDANGKDDDDTLLADNITGVNAEEIDEAEIDKAPNNGDNQENEEVEQEAGYEIKPDETESDENGTSNEVIELDKEPKGEADNNNEPMVDAINEQTTIDQTMTDKYGERSEGRKPKTPTASRLQPLTCYTRRYSNDTALGESGFEGFRRRWYTSSGQGTTTTARSGGCGAKKSGGTHSTTATR
jgi:hypothetical protein